MDDPITEFRKTRDGTFAEVLDVEMLLVEPDRVIAQVHLRPELLTTNGVVHGGVLMAFADEVGAYATVVNLPANHFTTTLESKTNFITGGRGSLLRAEATPLHKGRRTMVWVTRISDEHGRLISVTTQTQMVIERRTHHARAQDTGQREQQAVEKSSP